MEDISIEWAFMIGREVDSNLLSFTCIVGIHYIHLHALKARWTVAHHAYMYIMPT